MIEEVSYIKPPYVVQKGFVEYMSFDGTVEELGWEFHSAYGDLGTAEIEARKLAQCEEHVRIVKR